MENLYAWIEEQNQEMSDMKPKQYQTKLFCCWLKLAIELKRMPARDIDLLFTRFMWERKFNRKELLAYYNQELNLKKIKV